MTDNAPIIVALDFADPAKARALVSRLTPGSCRLKVGKELFVSGGPELLDAWVQDGWEIFLDLKFHDIPNTVAGACRAAAKLGVWMVNVHALGGSVMMQAAREAVESGAPAGIKRPLLTAVTVLTSHDASTLTEIGLLGSPEEAVLRLGKLAEQSGLDGVVCSAREAQLIERAISRPFRRVTPGIRPADASQDDQRRVLTPAEAIHSGATDLVIGRPITASADPLAALQSIQREIDITTSSPRGD